MTPDITKQLADAAKAHSFKDASLYASAKREIEAERAENARLREALERIERKSRQCGGDSQSMSLCVVDVQFCAIAALTGDSKDG